MHLRLCSPQVRGNHIVCNEFVVVIPDVVDNNAVHILAGSQPEGVIGVDNQVGSGAACIKFLNLGEILEDIVGIFRP